MNVLVRGFGVVLVSPIIISALIAGFFGKLTEFLENAIPITAIVMSFLIPIGGIGWLLYQLAKVIL